MSRIGRKPIIVGDGVEVKLAEGKAEVKGPKGQLSFVIPNRIKVNVEDGKIKVERVGNEKATRALHGLTRSLIQNMVQGVTEGYIKKLMLIGVGFRAEVVNGDLILQLGFSHPVKVDKAEGVDFTVEKNIITVSGIDKQKVGQLAAVIRGHRPPEPYKGKGIRYIDEIVKLKPGKQAKTTTVA